MEPFAQYHIDLECLVLQVHLEQRVSHQMSEATAVEITVRMCVTSGVVDLRELQATVLMEVFSVEILVLAEHLLKKRMNYHLRSVERASSVTMSFTFNWTHVPAT